MRLAGELLNVDADKSWPMGTDFLGVRRSHTHEPSKHPLQASPLTHGGVHLVLHPSPCPQRWAPSEALDRCGRNHREAAPTPRSLTAGGAHHR